MGSGERQPRLVLRKRPQHQHWGRRSQVGEGFKQVPGKLHAGCNTSITLWWGEKGSVVKEMTQNQFRFWLTK